MQILLIKDSRGYASTWSSLFRVNSLLFRMFVASVITVDSTWSQTTCSLKRALRILRTDRIILSHGPTMWLAPGGLKIYSIPLCVRKPFILCWFQSSTASFNSLTALLKFEPQSLRISLGYPRRVMNLLSALIMESVFRLCATSTCMARTVKHVNKQTPTFNSTSSLLHLYGLKIVHSDMCEGGFVWSKSILRQLGHKLLSSRCFPPLAIKTFLQRATHCRTSFHNPEPFPQG